MDIMELVNQLTHESAMQIESIPQIDLYVDQVTTLLERELGATKRSEEDKVMTKTMINNYSKEKLLPPSNKKKYARHHILLLALIYEYKQILTIGDIHTLLGPMIEDEAALEDFYRIYIEEDAEQKALLQKALESRPVTDLRVIASALTIRAALEKRLAERILDRIQDAQPAEES